MRFAQTRKFFFIWDDGLTPSCHSFEKKKQWKRHARKYIRMQYLELNLTEWQVMMDAPVYLFLHSR